MINYWLLNTLRSKDKDKYRTSCYVHAYNPIRWHKVKEKTLETGRLISEGINNNKTYADMCPSLLNYAQYITERKIDDEILVLVSIGNLCMRKVYFNNKLQNIHGPFGLGWFDDSPGEFVNVKLPPYNGNYGTPAMFTDCKPSMIADAYFEIINKVLDEETSRTDIIADTPGYRFD